MKNNFMNQKHIIYIILIFILNASSISILGAQSIIPNEINLDENPCELYFIHLSEKNTEQINGASFYINNSNLKSLQEFMEFEELNAINRCGNDYIIYILNGEKEKEYGYLNLRCNQLKIDTIGYNFERDDFKELIYASGNLRKKYFTFSDIFKARNFYEEKILSDSSIILKNLLQPDWYRYEGFFRVEKLDYDEMGFDQIKSWMEKELEGKNISIRYSMSSYSGKDKFTRYSIEVYSDYNFYKYFKPESIKLSEGKGEWIPFQDFAVTVFEKE